MHKLLTIELVALATCLSEVTIRHWAYGHRAPPAGFPKPIRVGRQIRFVEEEFNEWINAIRGAHDTPKPYVAPSAKRRGRPRKSASSIGGVSNGQN